MMKLFSTKKNTFFGFALILTICISFAACKQKEQAKTFDYKSVPQNVLLGDAGVFRGFTIGDSFTSVQTKEKQKASETDSAYLYYEYSIQDSLGSFNITYNFNEALELTEIQSNIFINNGNETETVLNSFKTYFDKYFGPSRTEMGYFVWTVKSAKYGTVRIDLGDESSDFTIDGAPGKLSLWIYVDENV